jgi:hypothetical protein
MSGPVAPLTRWRDPVVARAAHLLLPFYRRFPQRGPMPLSQMDPRGVAIPAEGIFYNRVPKAANSTIVRFLADRSAYVRPFHRAGAAKSRFLRPSWMSGAMVARMEAEWFLFTLVRHPMTRALSAYLDKIAGRKGQSRPFYAWFGTAQEPTFTDFCRYLEAGGLWHDMHWAPQSGILLLPPERFHMIGRFERLEADLAEVARRGFGQDMAATPPRRAGPRATGADGARAAHLTDQARDILTRLYAEDFRSFGYDPAS